MRKMLCKIWNFILGLVTDIVDLVVDTIQKIAQLVVDIVLLLVEVVDEVVEGVTDGLFGEGGLKKFLMIGLIGFIVVSASKNRSEGVKT